MRLSILVILLVMTSACSSKPVRKGFELPAALSEVYRGGELKGLEQADSPDLGMPNQYDLVSHVCHSQPIFDLWGRYVRTSVKCW